MDDSSVTGDANANIVEDGDLILRVGREHGDGEIRIRVSSKVLTERSRVFKTMLDGPFLEGQLQLSSEDPPTLDLPEDSAMYMLNLCKILHPNVRDSRELILPYSMIGVGVVSDKYGCQRFTKAWLTYRLLHQEFALVSSTAEEIGQVIQAAYLFEHAEAFHLYTRKAIMTIDWANDLDALKLGLGDTFSGDFMGVLGGIKGFLWSRLSHECEKVHVQLLRTDSRGRDRFLSFIAGPAAISIPHQCDTQDKRTERWATTVGRHGLLVGTPDDPHCTLHETLNALFEATKKGDDTTCFTGPSRLQCNSCHRGWGPTRDMVLQFRNDAGGVCLICLNDGRSGNEQDEDSRAQRKCQEHPIPYPSFLSTTSLREECPPTFMGPRLTIEPYGYVPIGW